MNEVSTILYVPEGLTVPTEEELAQFVELFAQVAGENR